MTASYLALALESIVEQLQRQNVEQQELLQRLSEDWRNDCERHHKDTLDAVKSTAQEQVPFNVKGVSTTDTHNRSDMYTHSIY